MRKNYFYVRKENIINIILFTLYNNNNFNIKFSLSHIIFLHLLFAINWSNYNTETITKTTIINIFMKYLIKLYTYLQFRMKEYTS